jgi:hypothetical protein
LRSCVIPRKVKPFGGQVEQRATVTRLLGFERKLEAILSDLAVFEHWRILSVPDQPASFDWCSSALRRRRRLLNGGKKMSFYISLAHPGLAPRSRC